MSALAVLYCTVLYCTDLYKDCATLTVLVNAGVSTMVRHSEGRLVYGGLTLRAGVRLVLVETVAVLQPGADLE